MLTDNAGKRANFGAAKPSVNAAIVEAILDAQAGITARLQTLATPQEGIAPR